jgi:hypothetical protein
MDARRIPFTREDEERIASAGLWGIVVAVTSLASALIGAALSVMSRQGGEMFRGLLGLTLNGILALWLLQASLAFRRVATTDEADEHYLLLGFSKLRGYFMMTGILIFIGFGLVVLVILGSLACGAMMRGV